MTVIGDALSRADRENRPGQDRSSPKRSDQDRVGSCRAEVALPRIDPVVFAAKGIAHPRELEPVKRQSNSPFLGATVVLLLGFAAYMIAFPEWVDSLWQFRTPTQSVAKSLAVPSRSVASRQPKPHAQALPISEPKQAATSLLPIGSIVTKPIDGEDRTNRAVPRSITQIPVQSEPTATRFSVEGIMLGGRRTLAVINGAIVGIGDEVDGATVRAITDTGVSLKIGSRIRRFPIRAANPPVVEGKPID